MSEPIRKRDGFEGQQLLVLSEQVIDMLSAHPLTRECYVTDIGYFPAAKYHFRQRPDGSTSHILIVCVDGSGWVESNASEHVGINQGQWFLVPAHLGHTYGAYEHAPWSIYWFHFSGETADEWVTHLLGNFSPLTGIPLPINFMQRFITLFQEVLLTLEQGITHRHLVYATSVSRHMLGLLQHSSELSSQTLRHNQLVERSIALMQNRLSSTITLQDLADHVGLSKTQFTYVFKRETGRTPIDYYLHLKMQRACQYLESTDWSIKQISLTLNIEDPYYFSRSFHKFIGVPPSAYRLDRKG